MLLLPSFLHGSQKEVRREARAEGGRCARQYQLSDAFPQPRELLPLQPGEVVIVQGAADFQQHLPAWRLHGASDVLVSLGEALEWKNYHQAGDMYEACFRQTAWGALYFATAGRAPESAERSARRIEAVLRFWDSLQTVRYLFKKPGTFLTLDELMSAACGWAMEAWCPEEGGPVRARLEQASTRMARATREDCVETILRRLPRMLEFARALRHPEVVTDPAAWRERLTALDPESFERISGACPAWVLEQLYLWDEELEMAVGPG
jgi:hypothetical protein